MKVSFYWGILCILVCIKDPVSPPHPLLPLFIILLIPLRYLWSDSIAYHRMTKTAPILESVYTGDIAAFSRFLYNRISHRTILSLYLILTTCVYTHLALEYLTIEWAGWICKILCSILILFTIRSLWINIKLFRAKIRLDSNPTAEQCRDIAQTVLHLDYTSHYENRLASSYSELFSPTPPHYKAYLTISAIPAIFTILFGVFMILILSIDDEEPIKLNLEVVSIVLVYIIPPLYCGISDLISRIPTRRTLPANIPSSTN